MKKILIAAASSVLYCLLVGFTFALRDHLITYAVATLLVFPAGYFFNRFLPALVFLLPPLVLTMFIALVNSDMFSITLPILGLGTIIGYVSGLGFFLTRNSFWKWIITAGFLTISIVIILIVIPRRLLSVAVEANEQVVSLPQILPLLNPQSTPLDLSNKILVIELWQSNCAPCLHQFNVLERVHQHYRSSKDVAVIAMNTGREPEDKARTIFLRQQVSLNAGYDKNESLSRQLAVNSVPILVIVDRNNRVRWKHNGFYNEEKDILDKEIIKHIEEIRQ